MDEDVNYSAHFPCWIKWCNYKKKWLPAEFFLLFITYSIKLFESIQVIELNHILECPALQWNRLNAVHHSTASQTKFYVSTHNLFFTLQSVVKQKHIVSALGMYSMWTLDFLFQPAWKHQNTKYSISMRLSPH